MDRVKSQGFSSHEEILHAALSYFKNLICQSAHSLSCAEAFRTYFPHINAKFKVF